MARNIFSEKIPWPTIEVKLAKTCIAQQHKTEALEALEYWNT